MEGEQIKLKEVKEIQADSLQSPHDQDAAFRNKGGTKVQGYSVNLTETCNKDELNLITDVKVTNRQTGEIFEAEHYKEGKWKIKDNGEIKYFSYAFILSYYNRLRIEGIPQSEKNRRNNVEASIFQLSYFTRNNKTRYRGKFKHQLWAYSRCIWINLVRIKNYMGEVCPVEPEFSKKAGLLVQNALRHTFFVLLAVLNFPNQTFYRKYLAFSSKICYI